MTEIGPIVVATWKNEQCVLNADGTLGIRRAANMPEAFGEWFVVDVCPYEWLREHDIPHEDQTT